MSSRGARWGRRHEKTRRDTRVPSRRLPRTGACVRSLRLYAWPFHGGCDANTMRTNRVVSGDFGRFALTLPLLQTGSRKCKDNAVDKHYLTNRVSRVILVFFLKKDCLELFLFILYSCVDSVNFRPTDFLCNRNYSRNIVAILLQISILYGY